VNSNNVKITVFSSLYEGTPSTDQNISYNSVPTTLSCTAPSGGDGSFTYQWQTSNDKLNWSNITNATGSTYLPEALNTTTYFRRSAISSCGIVYSSAITITVYGQFLPGSIGYDQTICNGATPNQLVGSAPSGGTGSYTYQWQFSNDGSNFIDILGATGSVYTPQGLSVTTYYRRSVTSGISGTVYSNILRITVNGVLTEGTLSAPQTICYSTTANPLLVSAPSGGSGTYMYQWQSCTDMYSWQDIPGANSSGYLPMNLTTSTFFRRVVTSGNCGTAYSNAVKITVQGQVLEGIASPDQTVCYNSTPSMLSCSAPSGGTSSYTYQWQLTTDNFNWLDIVGATNQTFTPGALTSTTFFRRVVTSGSCGSANSSPIKISTLTRVTSGFILSDQTKCYSSIPDEVTGTNPAGGNGSGSYSYQWQKSVDLNTWSDIIGAINNSYQADGLTKTTYYRRIVTSGTCGSATSNIVTITITPPLSEGTTSQNQTICFNTIPNTLTVTSATGGIPSEYYFQWQSSSDNYSWNNFNGATTINFKPPALTTNAYFRRALTTNSCGTVYSNSVLITVNANLNEGSISSDQTICYFSTPGRISVTSPTGGTGTYTYQWQSSTDNYDYEDVSGAMSASYIPGKLTETTYFRRAVTSGTCGTVYSNSMVVNVLPNIKIGRAHV
jgi:hypothetical protein